MKIGIDIRNIGKKRTGDEVVFLNLVKNLALIDSKNDYQLFTDIVSLETLDKIKKDLGIENKDNFAIIPLETKNKFTWNFWTLPKYLRKNPLDVYLTQYITPFFVPRKIRIATIVHDVSFCAYPEHIKKSDLFFLKVLIPLSLRRADKIIAVSRFTRDEILLYYRISPKKTTWIYNAVADDYLKTEVTAEMKEMVRKKYDLPQKFILYIGTLQPRKNVPMLIYAFQKIKNQIPGVGLVLAGGKGHNFDKRITRAINRYGIVDQVLLPGFIDEADKPVLMNLADVFVFPSLYEGFGIPILEAFASRVPVVASRIMPHKEIADQAALFFNPADSQELGARIIQTYTDLELRKNLIESGSIRLENFSWQKTAERMLKILKGEIGNN